MSGHGGKSGRNAMFGIALDILAWLEEKQGSFTIRDIAEEIEVCDRTAWRYVTVLISRDLVEQTRAGNCYSGPSIFKSRIFRPKEWRLYVHKAEGRSA